MEVTDLKLINATEEILLKVKLQIEKDLSFCGFLYSLDSVKDLSSLLPELLEKIKELSRHGAGDIMKIVNRVDLTEKQYRTVNIMEGEWASNLAKGIVLREFQKIILRNRYS